MKTIDFKSIDDFLKGMDKTLDKLEQQKIAEAVNEQSFYISNLNDLHISSVFLHGNKDTVEKVVGHSVNPSKSPIGGVIDTDKRSYIIMIDDDVESGKLVAVPRRTTPV